MNILFLDQFGELGGAQRCLLDLLPALRERGWGIHLAAPPGGQLAECAAEFGATADPIECGPFSSGKKTLRDVARFVMQGPQLSAEILRLARCYRADLIYVNGPRLLPAAAAAARHGPPLLFHSHSFLSGYVRRLAGRALERAKAAMIASSRFVAQPLLAYSGERGIRVIYNGVGQMAMARRDKLGGEIRIGMIGRISPEKGQADFLRAARILHPFAPDCRFVICGAPLFSDPAALWYCASLEALAADLPVEFAGWQDNIEEVLARLDLLIVPSAAIDATPRVILEAFAAGVPVVAFASGGIPEIIEDRITGFLVEQRSPRALAFAMRDALREPRLREIVFAAQAKARDEFNLNRYRRQIMQVVEIAVQ
jgi:glycosyltransferase involved in cell wall biosynthesis